MASPCVIQPHQKAVRSFGRWSFAIPASNKWPSRASFMCPCSDLQLTSGLLNSAQDRHLRARSHKHRTILRLGLLRHPHLRHHLSHLPSPPDSRDSPHPRHTPPRDLQDRPRPRRSFSRLRWRHLCLAVHERRVPRERHLGSILDDRREGDVGHISELG